jgi:hypothetical protein
MSVDVRRMHGGRAHHFILFSRDGQRASAVARHVPAVNHCACHFPYLSSLSQCSAFSIP